ncbi:uncharacterized protein LOC128547568 [Mercenaria mercenaria]|uniref:uncharacterized protein LOC128547568 n=1 Tax=Mercenaria mercenaria TaxID=6596 RepID=UPI00234F60A6|nr:uncharacterized protein LOC128547568 [Mercenaria mercenaria]
MDLQTLKRIFDENKSKHNIDYEIKDEQLMITHSIAKGRNCLGFLPTGFGKTLCFVINAITTTSDPLPLIISPLLSLMENQIVALKEWTFTCARISADATTEDRTRISNGEFDFVFSSPESILRPVWRKMFLTDTWQRRMSCITFDEAHCLSEWEEDFRPEYREMAQLRSFFKVPVMAVTATSTTKVEEDICQFYN